MKAEIIKKFDAGILSPAAIAKNLELPLHLVRSVLYEYLHRTKRKSHMETCKMMGVSRGYTPVPIPVKSDLKRMSVYKYSIYDRFFNH